MENAIPVTEPSRGGHRAVLPYGRLTNALMNDVIDADGYRANVGIVLMHREQVFLGRRAGGRGWQFPQGGVRSGESLEEAVYRELEEEIGIGQSAVDLVGQTGRWLRIRSRLRRLPT